MKTKTSNFTSSMLLGVMTLVMASIFSGFTAHKADNLADVCFQFEGPDNPDGGQATTPGLYSSVTGDPNCNLLRLTLCGICFDTEDFPLVNEQPDFGDEDLSRIIQENKANTALHGSPYTDPLSGKTVTLYFRALDQ